MSFSLKIGIYPLPSTTEVKLVLEDKSLLVVTSSGTLKQIMSKFKKKNLQIYLIRDALKYLGPLLLKKIFPKLMLSIITWIDINFIVDYLDVFNMFLMNSWYREQFANISFTWYKSNFWKKFKWNTKPNFKYCISL